MLYGSIPVSMNADPNATIFKKVTAARYAFGMSADDVTFYPYWEPTKDVRLIQGKSRNGVDEEGKIVRASVFTRKDKVLIVLVNFGSSTADVQVVLSDEMLKKSYPGYRLKECVAERDVELTTVLTRQDAALPGRRCRVSLGGHGFTLLLGEADRSRGASAPVLPDEGAWHVCRNP